MAGRKGFRRVWLSLLCGLLSMALLVAVFSRKVRPVVWQYANNCANTMASDMMSVAVGNVLQNGAYSYADLTMVSRDSTGNLLSVQVDAVAVNRLAAELTAAVGDLLREERFATVRFSLFDATGNVLLTGRGPKVNVTIRQNGAVRVNLKSEFSSAGINQTLHRLELFVTFRAMVLSVGLSEPIEIDSTFLIAETVIVGAVPDAYTNVTVEK